MVVCVGIYVCVFVCVYVFRVFVCLCVRVLCVYACVFIISTDLSNRLAYGEDSPHSPCVKKSKNEIKASRRWQKKSKNGRSVWCVFIHCVPRFPFLYMVVGCEMILMHGVAIVPLRFHLFFL